ncbi:MAG: patatin-like phospholipase family protein [Candidatus Cloacimonadaceae bacterium]|jgi:NTE family protein|nr:patatin-like phospholipase family protein [Candidatus Cloacimonadota bacterium]MCB5254632.1 patatin-like phospholipase family protein [Candidatus Cloacimonadota bacterium]MCK9177719.1 patatin-like phospholipase family protein [Candidatus Cloacimonadota bacterium]MCK9241893.1 patatin-like phospholipase family protein [Candidatus Cloacimonadota bacterium]MDY0126560.1 patatin-like phospholipase family protein [Candidatus Cloacimonadaceae bacterium]
MKKLAFIIAIAMLTTAAFANEIGYALSGGGARGFAHIGILKVLEEEGLRPDYISGTSIGAIIGALYAMGYDATEIQEISCNTDWAKLMQDKVSRRDLYIGQKRWAPYGNVVFELDQHWKPKLPSAVFKVNSLNLKLFDLVAGAAQEQDFLRYPIPFSCIATNLVTGEPQIFESGSLVQALRASISIPSILPPFQVGDQYYIDGGISKNLPIEQVQKMGADLVVGIKVNSSLRDADQLSNLVAVLDQTINIGITRNLNENLDQCDLLLEPDLLHYSSANFKYVSEIIAIGENYAREHIEEIRAFIRANPRRDKSTDTHLDKARDSFPVSSIEVYGHKYLSAAKIREYLGLHSGGILSKQEIFAACQRAWNSQYFNVLYPDLVPLEDGSYQLNIHVSERQPKTIAINNSYGDVEKLTASVVLNVENLLLKNSRFMAGVLLGGKNELNIDYVKNFGDFWGVYYRLFPYINEKTLYAYNDDHYRINSVKSLKWGGTTGLGIFTKDIAIAELFLYHSNTRLYREISESEMLPRSYTVSGFGVKGYHESLDNYVFPYSGARVMGKFNFARDEQFSDYIYNSMRGNMEGYIPLAKGLSFKASANIGSYFDSTPSDKFDPFAIGGIDGFKGYSQYEISAPHYMIYDLGLVLNPVGSLHLQAGFQGMSYDDDEFLILGSQKEHCVYAGIGYDTMFAPLRLQFAFNERKDLNTMLFLGSATDIFEFSRK